MVGKVEEKTYQKYLLYKRMYRFVQTETFKAVWEHLTDSQKDYAFVLIESGNISVLRDMIARSRNKKIETMTVAELRRVAKLLHVANYWLETKERLVTLIKEAENVEKEKHVDSEDDARIAGRGIETE